MTATAVNSTISKLAIVPRITDSELGKNWTHCSVYEQWRWIRSKGQKGYPSGGWEGGRLQKINNRPFQATNMPLPPPPNQMTPVPISRENTLQTSDCGFYNKRGAHDGAICIYSFEYINWCKSRAICHIPALNQLPWNILASLNSQSALYNLICVNGIQSNFFNADTKRTCQSVCIMEVSIL